MGCVVSACVLEGMGSCCVPVSETAWSTFALVVLFSCHGISDLSLLGVEEPLCILSEESVVLQVGFGLKQAWPGHSSPVIQLSSAPDEELCPLRHVKSYLQIIETLRSSKSLFVTAVPIYGAAAKITLKHWFIQVLPDEGLEASPRSSKAAVALTALAKWVAVDSVMRVSNWVSVHTLFAHYIHLLPAEALWEAANRSVQSALLNV